MITEQDLQAAIAECNGKRNPDANTCIKLAAFYAIKDHLYPLAEKPVNTGITEDYSYDAPPIPDHGSRNDAVNYIGDTDFSDLIYGKSVNSVLKIIDDALEALSVLNPSFYDNIMRKLESA